MCSNHRLACSCGRNKANIMFKNHILPPMVVSNLYCPECSENVVLQVECMIFDNNWIMEFDVTLADGYLKRVNVDTDCINPEFLFDEGYATWNGFTPNDLDHRLTEREKIVALAAHDMRQYLAEMKRWGCERVQKFREAGWRKAQQC